MNSASQPAQRKVREELVLNPNEGAIVQHPSLDAMDTSENGLLEYWFAIRRRFGIVALAGLVGMLIGVGRALMERPAYSGYTTVEMQLRRENVLNLKDVDANSGISPVELLLTNIKLLQSKSLLERTQERLNAAEPADFVYQVSPLESWLRRAGVLSTPNSSEWRTAVAETAGSLVIRPSGGTRIVEIFSRSADSRLAADFVNAHVEEFVKQILDSRWNSSVLVSRWLNGQLGPLKQKLEQSEENLQDYVRTAGLVFSNENNLEAEHLRQLQSELSTAEADRIAKQAVHETVSRGSVESVPQILDNDRIVEYQTKLADLRRELAEMQTIYLPQHYRVKRIRAQINELESTSRTERANIIAKLEHEFEAAMSRQRLLRGAYMEQVRRMSEQSDKQMNYTVLKREVELNRDLYQSVVQRIKEVDLSAAMRASDIRVVDPAKPGGYRLNYIPNAVVGLLTGLLLGAISVIAIDRSDRSIKSPGEVRSYLCTRELGVIPTAGVVRKAGSSAMLAMMPQNDLVPPEPMELAVWDSHPSAVANSFRLALASVLFSIKSDATARLIVVTSPGPHEGKTAVVSNLGIAVAEINRRVLLIDCDIRKPRLHRIFNVSNSWGLTDLLRERTLLETCPLQALVRETRIPGLSLLPSGPGAASISTLLYSTRLPDILKRFRNEFEIVLIDTPPILHVPDARVLARFADGMILVVRAGQTNRNAAMAARRRIEEDGTHLFGTILNAWSPETKADYYDLSYHSGYQDGNSVSPSDA